MKVKLRCDPALADILPRPRPAKTVLPDWLRAMPARAASEIHGRQIRTVKQCPPFVDAMAHGFIVPLPCDVTVDAGVFSWDWQLPPSTVKGHPRAPLSFHVPEQVENTPFDRGGCAVVKFNSFWIFETEPGYSLFAMHPVNRDDLPFRLIAGMVDTDRFVDVGINFPAVWTDPEYSGVLPRGTPVAQCFPVRRAALKLEFAGFSRDEAARYGEVAAAILAGPGVYRKRFRDKTSRSTGQMSAQGRKIEP